MAPPLVPLIASSTSGVTDRSQPVPELKVKKAWEIAPRPKPGRKSKAIEEDPSSGNAKIAKNRASQAAFRKRQSEYVGELEAKVKELEARISGGGFYQEEVKRLKAENDQLRRDKYELESTIGKTQSKRVSEIELLDDIEPKRRRRSSTRTSGTELNYLKEDELQEPPEALIGTVAECGNCQEDSCFCAEVGYEVDHTNRIRIIGNSSDAVPLKLRASTSKKPSVWTIEEKLCNGNPDNCPACADDPFGKAFCNALSTSVCTNNPCSTCPNRSDQDAVSIRGKSSTQRERSHGFSLPSPPKDHLPVYDDVYGSLADLPCCGDPKLCGSLTCAEDETKAETLPCNDAWTLLKCHPNIGYANLQMLADVVSKRTSCNSAELPIISRNLKIQSNLTAIAGNSKGQRLLKVDREAVDEALQYLDSSVRREGI